MKLEQRLRNSSASKIRQKLMHRTAQQLKEEYGFLRCECCGKLFKLCDIECHHGIIPIHDIIEEFKSEHLTLKSAKELARSKENIMFLCKDCHKKIHKIK